MKHEEEIFMQIPYTERVIVCSLIYLILLCQDAAVLPIDICLPA